MKFSIEWCFPRLCTTSRSEDRDWVLGTWYLVLDVGTCCDRHDLLNLMVLVSSHFDSGTWYLVFGTWYLVLDVGTHCDRHGLLNTMVFVSSLYDHPFSF